MVTLKVIKRKELPTRRAEARALLPDGSVLFGLGAKYFVWDSDRETIQELGELPGVIAAMDVSSDGTMWGVVAGQIGKINVQSGKINFEPKISMDGKFLQIADNVMYWTVGSDIYAKRRWRRFRVSWWARLLDEWLVNSGGDQSSLRRIKDRTIWDRQGRLEPSSLFHPRSWNLR